MENQIIKYTPIKSDDVGMIKWNESTYRGTPVYIGLPNELVVVVCTQHSAIEYDAIAVRFRLRNYEFIKGKRSSKGITTIYRHGYILSDLREGLWLSEEEILKINDEIDKLLNEFKVDFIGIK